MENIKAALDQLPLPKRAALINEKISSALDLNNISRESDKLSCWLLGDLFLYADENNIELPDEITSSIHPKTRSKYKNVARAFDYSRRRESLSFSHHVVVASLNPNDADELLDMAEEFEWSESAFRLFKNKNYPHKKRKSLLWHEQGPTSIRIYKEGGTEEVAIINKPEMVKEVGSYLRGVM